MFKESKAYRRRVSKTQLHCEIILNGNREELERQSWTLLIFKYFEFPPQFEKKTSLITEKSGKLEIFQ